MPKRNVSASEEAQVEANRKHERLKQRDREQHRKLYLGVGIAIAAAIVLVVIGVFAEFGLRPNRAVATVDDDTIVARDFGKRVLMEQNNLQNMLRFYALQEQQFGNQGFFSSQINQLQATLASPFALGQQTIDLMVNEILIKREADARGITVTDAEVDEALREEVASGLGLVTEPQAAQTAEAGAIATATAELWTPTAEPTVDASAQVSTTAEITPAATTLPTLAPASVISDTGFTEGLATLEQNIRAVSGMTIAEYREIVRAQLLQEKVSDEIATDEVETTQEQVHARHILISEIEPTPTPTEVPAGDPTPEPTPTATALPEGAPTPAATPGPRTRAEAEVLAQELYQRLIDGEDFAEIAAEYSDDQSNAANGGDLDWFAEGAMVAPFSDAAFSLPVGEVSQPISTTFGYHIIEVLERDDARPKEESTLEQERGTAFNTWLEAQVAAANVERNDITGNLPRELR